MYEFSILNCVFGFVVISDGLNKRFRQRPAMGEVTADFSVIDAELIFFNFYQVFSFFI